jgi:hypothetical protein
MIWRSNGKWKDGEWLPPIVHRRRMRQEELLRLTRRLQLELADRPMTELAIACWLATARYSSAVSRFPCGKKRVYQPKGPSGYSRPRDKKGRFRKGD